MVSRSAQLVRGIFVFAATNGEGPKPLDEEEVYPVARQQLVDMSRRRLVMVLPLCCAAAAASPAIAGEMPDPANSCLECDGTGIVPCEYASKIFLGRAAQIRADLSCLGCLLSGWPGAEHPQAKGTPEQLLWLAQC